MKKAAWFFLFLIMGVSCLDQPDCFRQNLNLVGVSFKKMFDGQADSVVMVRVSALNNMWQYDTLPVTSLSLPVNFIAKDSATTFLILRKNAEGEYLTDTLKVKYRTKAQFVSADCGERFLVSNLRLVKSGFDSIQVISDVLSNPVHTNIIAYRCPITNYMKFAFRQLYLNDTIGKLNADARILDSVARILDSVKSSAITLIKSKVNLSSVILPLDVKKNTSSFSFHFADGSVNKLTVTYTKTPRIIFGKLCGEQQIFKLDTTQANNITSTFTKNTTITQFLKVRRDSLFDPPLTNIEIVRCPQNNLITLLFKTILASSSISFRDSVVLKSVTSDYTDTLNLVKNVANTKVTNVTLPLNPKSTQTTFTFEMANSISKTLTLSYVISDPIPYSVSQCGNQTILSGLTLRTTFNPQTKVTVTDVKFPAVTNIEIVQ